jgi:hypothetical protein
MLKLPINKLTNLTNTEISIITGTKCKCDCIRSSQRLSFSSSSSDDELKPFFKLNSENTQHIEQLFENTKNVGNTV